MQRKWGSHMGGASVIASLMQSTDALMQKLHRITAPPVRGALMQHRCTAASMFLFPAGELRRSQWGLVRLEVCK
jgi:hypothetical protein